MPVFLIMYMTASVIAVILESTMNFKLFAKRKEVVEGEPKGIDVSKYESGACLFEITTDYYDDYLDISIHQLPIWCIHGWLFIHSH